MVASVGWDTVIDTEQRVPAAFMLLPKHFSTLAALSGHRAA